MLPDGHRRGCKRRHSNRQDLEETIISGYKPGDIFNADEAGHFFKAQPSKTRRKMQQGMLNSAAVVQLGWLRIDETLGYRQISKPTLLQKYLPPALHSEDWMKCSLFEEFLA
ncbi:hypothetical protein HPB49_000858 [Dermacentor silvarum]|uniref:Uncharacterized protein n=1 Tax=Dermacentor silvarum TaxID=543639 RepID=A0ACB8DHW5_DERSI|nr:hypothetical protein HPB49_000858 [Dermacentor silvarum]